MIPCRLILVINSDENVIFMPRTKIITALFSHPFVIYLFGIECALNKYITFLNGHTSPMLILTVVISSVTSD